VAVKASQLGAALERALPLLTEEARNRAQPSPAGYLDLLGPSAPDSTGIAQNMMLGGVLPAVYERWWRPAMGRVVKGVFGPGMADEHRIARLLLALSPGDGVLDVACGTGNFTRGFARTVGADGLVVGIDVSETMLGRAVRDTEDAGLADVAAFVRGDAADLPFRDSSFDAVCCFAALNLFADPTSALDRMAAVLTPGGRIALFTSASGRTPPLRTAQGAIASVSGMRMFERDELVSALRQRGFVEIRQRITGFTQFVGGRLAT
jgi:ubiquinone/menaquinone biosynthesis C-methylase UbiE